MTNSISSIESSSSSQDMSTELLIQEVKLLLFDCYEFQNWDMYLFLAFWLFRPMMIRTQKNIDDFFLKNLQVRGCLLNPWWNNWAM